MNVQPVEQFIEVDGTKLWTCRQGQGVPVLLSSGGPGCCDYLGPVAELIDDMAEVFRWEQRGCGRSDTQETYDLADTLADLEKLRESFGLERWIVGGHSWGANLAMIYALEYPARTMAVIHISGTSFDQDWKAAYHEGLATRGERNPDFLYPPNMEVNRQLNRSKNLYYNDLILTNRLATLQVPVLLVHGSEDIRPTWTVKRMADQLPQAQFELIENAEHVLWPDYSYELREILRDFLADFSNT